MSTTNDTEAAILRAAEQEFMLKGYGGARTTSIAEKAGVTHAMLHYYYRTKESLYERIIEKKGDELLNQVLSLYSLEKDTSLVTKICNVVERHFDVLVRNPLLPLFIQTEFRNNPERLDIWFSKIKTVVSELAPQLQKEIETASTDGKICDISAMTLFSDIIALNLASVSFSDIFCHIYGISKDKYLEIRRKENVEVIRKRLLP